MAYRIRLLVPTSYTEEARTMIDEHPRATVQGPLESGAQPGSDLLEIVTSELRILHGLHRWWADRRNELRATPPMSLVQTDGVIVSFNDHTAEDLEAIGRRDALPQAS